jgi:hypothetical protein
MLKSPKYLSGRAKYFLIFENFLVGVGEKMQKKSLCSVKIMNELQTPAFLG